jgi:hypothetical protein
MKPIPELNREYHIFDDGKIRPSRHYKCVVIDIIPFTECRDEALLEAWKQEVSECTWLFAKETDCFVKALSGFDEYPLYFVRTLEGNWFSIDYPNWWMGAELDIDGSLYKILKGGKI